MREQPKRVLKTLILKREDDMTTQSKETKIVDACSVEKAGAQTQASKVPNPAAAKINTSGLSAALSNIVNSKMAEAMKQQAPQQQSVNPATLIAGASRRLDSLYASFDKLKKIAQRINGKNVTDSIPDNLRIDRIDIHFYACGEDGSLPRDEKGETADPEIATVKNIASVGDLGSLITTEMGVIIYSIQQEIEALSEVMKMTKSATDAARTSWDEANKDRKIQLNEAAETAPAAEEAK